MRLGIKIQRYLAVQNLANTANIPLNTDPLNILTFQRRFLIPKEQEHRVTRAGLKYLYLTPKDSSANNY